MWLNFTNLVKKNNNIIVTKLKFYNFTNDIQIRYKLICAYFTDSKL